MVALIREVGLREQKSSGLQCANDFARCLLRLRQVLKYVDAKREVVGRPGRVAIQEADGDIPPLRSPAGEIAQHLVGLKAVDLVTITKHERGRADAPTKVQ